MKEKKAGGGVSISVGNYVHKNNKAVSYCGRTMYDGTRTDSVARPQSTLNSKGGWLCWEVLWRSRGLQGPSADAGEAAHQLNTYLQQLVLTPGTN